MRSRSVSPLVFGGPSFDGMNAFAEASPLFFAGQAPKPTSDSPSVGNNINGIAKSQRGASSPSEASVFGQMILLHDKSVRYDPRVERGRGAFGRLRSLFHAAL